MDINKSAPTLQKDEQIRNQNKKSKVILRYVKRWEDDERLKPWLTSVPGDDRAAYCKVCRRPLQPHKKDLLLHATAKKHKKNMGLYKEVLASCEPLKETNIENVYEIDLNSSFAKNENGNINDVATDFESKGLVFEDDFSMQDIENWKNIPEFCGWLQYISNNLSCSACDRDLKPNRTYLMKHAAGKMHQRNCIKKNINTSNIQINSAEEEELRISLSLGTNSMLISQKEIDMRSDTLTRPGKEMKDTMNQAELGDDAYGTDPTVKKLEENVATLLGKNRALLAPSGTMANLIAVMTHCWSRDSEVIVGDESHLYRGSQGSLSRLCGISVRPIKNESDGTFSLDILKQMIEHKQQPQWPIHTLVCIENTHTRLGGRVLPLEWLDQLGYFCESNGIGLHMDGARLMNACLYTGSPPDRITRLCNSSTLCFNKGLGAPMGSVVVGDEEFIKRAATIRSLLGGTMHQSGIFASAALYALDYNTKRLQWDHSNARAIACSIREKHSSAVRVELNDVHTNIVHLYTDNIRVNAQELCDRLMTVKEKEVHDLGFEVKLFLQPVTTYIARLVTHCDLSKYDVQAAIRKINYVIDEYDNMLSLNFGS